MAKQSIDIGVQGNDGTGDSIREAFRKVNENFNDLYAVFGAGGQINSTNLDDFPSSYSGNQVFITNDDGTAVLAKSLVEGTGISIDTTSEDSIVIRSTSSSLNTDAAPALGGPLNANGLPIGNIAFPSNAVVNQWNAVHGPTGASITIDDLVINKGYADRRYIQQAGGGAAGQLRVRSEPSDKTEYTKTITYWTNGNAVIPAHSFDSGADGIAFKYFTTGTAATGLVEGTTYYLKYVDDNQLSLHPTVDDAKEGTNKLIIPDSGTGTQTLTDAYLDDTLSGNWVSNEALPRASTVRRQGDTMTGTLLLSDHPGTLAGSGTPNGDDDLQAATKYYVDNSSFASNINLFVSTTGDDAQTNTPPGKEGRAFAYAYETIGAACQRAEELIDLSALEPGPYRQKITYTVGIIQYESKIQSVGIVSGSGYTPVEDTLNANREYIRAEVIAYLNETYPDLTYNSELCSRDIGIIIDAVIIDVLVSGNYQSINAGKAYFRNISALVASGSQQTETVDGIVYAKYLASQVLQDSDPATTYQTVYTRAAAIGTVTAPMRTAVADKFDIVTDIITGGISAAPTRTFGTGVVSLVISNGGAGFVDQGNPSNVDIIPGKILRGLTSGAVAKIVSYASDSLTDTITGNLLTPYTFDDNEQLEFAEANRDLQITVRVESGVYYEDFPIRVPANVSIKGDEFRRTIIRPRDRASQSPWVETYFYRDTTFDGLTLTTTEYGYHYLKDPTMTMDTGPSYINAGGYVKAAKLLEINKTFIQTEVIEFVNAVYPSLVYDADLCYRDVGLIVDAVIEDLKVGNNAGVLDTAVRYYNGVIPSLQEVETIAAINYINTIAQKIILNQAPTVVRGTVDQIIDTSIVRETGTGTVISNLISTVVYAFDADFNPPKNNKELDMFLMNDAVKLHNITGQGQGGFMCVLDPAGAVGSKSPYVQSCSSISGSINAQRFAGGMFIDGFSGRLEATITSSSSFELTLSGLTEREPVAPTAFYNGGFRYQVDNVKSWNPTSGVAVIELNPTTPWAGGNIPIILETPGNRSMLANDFTQVNDLGYGIVAHNTGLTEQVSTFTYYCHTAYLASNGGQIRSIAGSNAHGNYGLRSVGSDPTEAPDQIVLADNMVQAIKVHKYATTSEEGLVNDIVLNIKKYRNLPTNTSEIEIKHSDGVSRYEVRNLELTGVYDNKYSFRISAISQATTCVVTTLTNKTITGATKANPCVITSVAHGFENGDYIKITGVSGMTQLNNKNFYVDKLTNDTFALYTEITLTNAIDSSSFGIWTSGGTISAYHSFYAGDRVTFTGVGGMTELNSNLYYVNPLTETTFELYTDSALTTPVDSTGFSAFTSGGTVTDDITYSINAATKASPCQVTSTVAHNFNNGDIVFITGISGMTQLDGYFYAKVNGANTVQLYTDSTLVTPLDSTTYSTYTSGGTLKGGQEVIKLNLSTASNDNRVATGLDEELYDGQNAIIRDLQNFKFTDVANVAPTRPSTALEFFDTITSTNNANLYRIIGYGLAESTGAPLPDNTAILTSDTTFDFVRPLILASAISTVDPIDGLKTMGATVGDTRLAIDADSLNDDDIDACNSNQWVFGWDGKLHRIVSFTPAAGLVPAYITIEDVYDNNSIVTVATDGINSVFPISTSTTLRAGLPAGSDGQVTIKISTCRATGHDFLDIGTGGYNTTNYPTAIFGNPAIAASQEREVVEETKGRVFYVSTDQDGVFRVGRYFSVDQGTGTVTFSASIALSNLDGIGFKRGVVVAEFSTDNTMTNNAADTVSTQSAVRGYIDRRLGLDHTGVSVPLANLIGPGYLPLNGSLAMKSTFNMAGYKILNVGSPTVDDDAATKRYVDTQIDTVDSFAKLIDVEINQPKAADLIVYAGMGDSTGNVFQNATLTGAFTLEFDSSANTVTSSFVPGSIVNTSIAADAAIDQSKLNLSDATAAATTGAAVKGIASFNSANFETDGGGFVSIKDSGIAVTKIANIGNGALLGNFTGSATYPQEVTASTVATKGLESLFTTNGALTRTGSETFAVVGISTTGGNNSLVKTDSNGIIDVKGLKINSSSVNIVDVTGTTVALNTPGSVSVIAAVGSTEATTAVTLKGQFTLGASSTLHSTSSTTATTATNANNLNVSGTYRSAALTATANTIAARDASGDIYANVFQGVASSARYADLAEYYTADKDYEPGTVVIFGGSAETTTTTIFGDARLAGVVSTNPAYMMNSDLQGLRVCIALQGRVPCKVVGRVKKGDMLTTAGVVGHAAKAVDPKVGTIIGKALEDKDYSEAGVIEVAVGRV